MLMNNSQNMAKVDPHGCWDGAIDGDDELDNMLGSILDFPDFPMEGLEGADWDASKSQYLGPIPMDVLLGQPTVAQTKVDTGPPVFMQPIPMDVLMGQPAVAQTKVETEPPVFMHKPDALEKQHSYWFSEDASGSCISQQNKSVEVQETVTFQSQSPVSVLESSISSSTGKSLLKPHPAKRARSKRARPTGMSPWLVISPILPTSSRKTCNAKKTKERRKKPTHPPVAPKQMMEDSSQSSGYSQPANAAQQRPIKKCTHCEITKTPQWREGPLGPKTLCNACGVRYRSGRLFPEYRPAASPTFVSTLHSNSHKKVIEMRNKGKKMEQPLMSPQLEFIPVSSYLLDPIC
ncbi:GATA transcription factor 11-like isoform X1 [Salvia splendens]|uniref:GATA transcription factor 11-like isoform X1 n=2 Tax=Salvia splendens TaxID=180675 RepID=UPI001C25493F|nr:GATA transcription factor 11-like isoform X1 [Salvia splendens]XP_041995495.1 GATA transcription factor 11-like isoform X1 [Salvia splendens]